VRGGRKIERKLSEIDTSVMSTLKNELIDEFKMAAGVAPSSLCIHIHSLLMDKELCESQNISIKFLHAHLVYLCLSS
jgi:hypothetical protein